MDVPLPPADFLRRRSNLSRSSSKSNNSSSPQRAVSQENQDDAASAAAGTRSPRAPSHCGYTARAESAGSIAGYLRQSYATWAGTDCTFSGCVPFPFASPPSPPSALMPTPRKKKYEGTLRLFAPSHPSHHADPALVLDEVADTLSGHPHPNTNPHPWAPLLLAGGAAGIIGWLGTFPFDVIKTRMQAHDIGNNSAHVQVHSGSGGLAGGGTLWRAARELYAEAAGDGGGGGARMRVFWRGFVPTIVRAVPVNMAVFGTFESVVWAFS